MLIKMLNTRYGSEDGFVVNLYKKDTIYEISDSLGDFFIKRGQAKEQPIVDGCTNPEWYNIFYDGNLGEQLVAQNIAAANFCL